MQDIQKLYSIFLENDRVQIVASTLAFLKLFSLQDFGWQKFQLVLGEIFGCAKLKLVWKNEFL